MGLSDVYEHYIDQNNNKFFTTHNPFVGVFIRQIQFENGGCVDCSDGLREDFSFYKKMAELGFNADKQGLFRPCDNMDKFSYYVERSQNGYPKDRKKVENGSIVH